MATATCVLLAAVCLQAAMPLSNQLSAEEEKVTRCIMEVLADSLSEPEPDRVSSACLRILKEDERVISMLRHQHLLRELEGLAHEGKPQHHEEDISESSEEEELRKRSKETPVPPSPKREVNAKRGGESKEHEETKEIEKMEKVEVKEKEHGLSGEERRLENAKELLEEEEDEEKRNTPVKRGEEEKKRAEKETRSEGATKRKAKKRFSSEDEDSSEEDAEDRGYHGNKHGWYHEGWEERKRASNRRMAEDPSEEETAQFESEDKGMKYYNSKTHMQGFHGEQKRHLYHPEEVELGRERSYQHPGEGGREKHYNDGRPESLKQLEEEEREKELEEIEEKEEHKAEERDLQEVEEELQRASEKLRELHRG
ncbi:uncharacterized protein O3C94_015370 isoform 2-T2 [Discoglossus pictus]